MAKSTRRQPQKVLRSATAKAKPSELETEPTAVQEAMQALRDAYARGEEIGRKFPLYQRLPDPREMTEPWFRELGFSNEDTPRKFRQLADAERGFSRKELDRIIRSCERAQFPLGISLLLATLSVPKEGSQRKQFLKLLIEGRWSYLRAKREIRVRFGRRRQGGKKRRLATGAEGLLAQLDGMILGIVRWYQTYSETGGSDASRLQDLPSEIRRELREIIPRIEELRLQISRRLEKVG